MKSAFIKAFAELEVPQAVYEALCLKIATLERRAARVHAVIFGLLSLVSLAALVPALQYAGDQFYASGFYEYFRLMFSDSAFVLTYWREFGLMLFDSLPSLAILILFPIAALLLWSLKRVAQTARTAFAQAS
jgi:hypothetical protein